MSNAAKCEQQPLHPDTPYSSPPSLYASFVALQDVDEEMGPTVYLPGTQTKAAQAAGDHMQATLDGTILHRGHKRGSQPRDSARSIDPTHFGLHRRPE